MKRPIMALAIAALVSAACSTGVHAQTADEKTEWAKKVVALQQGPELDRLVAQIAGRSAQELIDKWAPKLGSSVPKAKRQKATEDLDAELKKYSSGASQIITRQVGKISTDVLVPAYSERFTLEELKQIAAFFESPAIKKYQATAPELGTVFVQKLLEASRAEVAERASQFDKAAQKIVGSEPTAPKAAKPVKPVKK